MSFRAEALAKLRPNARWRMFGDDITWTDESQTQPTEEEIVAKATELENAEPLRLLRIERNAKLAETDWVVTMHKELGTNIPAAMKTYRAALRDITDSATSLDDVTWPEKP
jgi:hypothetical protein